MFDLTKFDPLQESLTVSITAAPDFFNLPKIPHDELWEVETWTVVGFNVAGARTFHAGFDINGVYHQVLVQTFSALNYPYNTHLPVMILPGQNVRFRVGSGVAGEQVRFDIFGKIYKQQG